MTALAIQRRHLIPFRSSLLPQIFTDTLVVGSGVAGLRCAIEASSLGDVIVLAKESLDLSSTSWAQGGIATVRSAEDSIAQHEADTLEAGAGLCDPQAVAVLVREGPGEVEQMIEWGMRVDRDADGSVSLGREGGHRQDRIVHADGDATGAALAAALIARVRALGSVRLFDRCFALDVLTRDDAGERRAAGVLTWHPRFGLQIVWARAVVLACGGAGQVYRETTNPKVATGDAVAMAWRAGVTVADLEFMQFHPTSLYVAGAPRHLISEAVRGEGAWLVDASGERFMHGVHPMAELAPRDIVSRGIVEHLARTGQSHAFLDCRHLGGGEPGFFARRFPGLDRMLAGFGLDASRELIPVNPAAHYTIGGVLTDLSGRTSLRGLYACGESASNGVHGANRLASNSLLDGLVFGRRVAHALAADALPDPVPVHTDSRIDVPERGDLDVADIRASLRSAMWRNVGVQRSATRLGDVLKMIEFWGRYGLHAVFERPSGWEAQNLLTVAHLMARAALERTESRGTHWRSDAPEPSPAWRVRLAWTPGRDQPDRLPIPLEARA